VDITRDVSAVAMKLSRTFNGVRQPKIVRGHFEAAMSPLVQYACD
jgi:hypothetical protein